MVRCNKCCREEPGNSIRFCVSCGWIMVPVEEKKPRTRKIETEEEDDNGSESRA